MRLFPRSEPSIYDIQQKLITCTLPRLCQHLAQSSLPYFTLFWSNTLSPKCGRHVWMDPYQIYRIGRKYPVEMVYPKLSSETDRRQLSFGLVKIGNMMQNS